MGNLDDLVKQFKPKRTFSCSHSKIEVDGVFVRVAGEDENDSWMPMQMPSNGGPPTHYGIKTEDLLQDPAVIRSARVSTGRDTKEVDEKAQGMMNFLWRDFHVTPYESGVVMRLRVETPIPYADPLLKIFASFNEFSGRYSDIDTGCYTPRGLSDEAQEQFDLNASESEELYKELRGMGLAREMARLCMPYRYYTKLYMTISLRHILDFLRLGNLPHRHTKTEFWEIRNVFEDIIKHWTPWAYEALKNHPHTMDFGWLREFLKIHSKRVVRLPYLNEKRVLDQGLVRLLDVKGDRDLMFTCLDDFPNPLRGFGHGSMTMLAHVPIHVLRQWVRHRYGAFTSLGINYDVVVEQDLFFISNTYRRQKGKAGSYVYEDMTPEENVTIKTKMLQNKNRQLKRYRLLRAIGVPQEVAMMVLPTCFYNWVVVTKPLESLFNFTSLRMDSHAQKETREYANAVWELFSGAYPDIAELFSEKFYYGDSQIVKDFKPE